MDREPAAPSVHSVDRCHRLLLAGLAALPGILASVASAAGPERIAEGSAAAEYTVAFNGPRVLWTEASDEYPQRPALRLRAVVPGATPFKLMRQSRPVKGDEVQAEVAASRSCVALNVDEWASSSDGESDVAYTLIRAGPSDGPFPILAGSLTRNGVEANFGVSGTSVAWIAGRWAYGGGPNQAYVRDCLRRRPSRAYGRRGAIDVQLAGDWVAIEYGSSDFSSVGTSIAVYRRHTGALAYEIPLTANAQPTDASMPVPWGLLAHGRLVVVGKSVLSWASPSHPSLRTLGARARRAGESPWWVFAGDGVLYTRRTGPRTDQLVLERLNGTIEWSSPSIARSAGVGATAFDGHRVVYIAGRQIFLARIG